MLVTPVIFDSLTAEEIECLCAGAVSHALNEGDKLLTRQCQISHVFVVQHGALRIWLEEANGDPFTLNFAAPGEIVGEISAVHGWGCSANVTAARPAQVLAIGASHFVACMRTMPILSFNVARLQMWRLCYNGEAALSLAEHTVMARVARQLLLLSARFPDTSAKDSAIIDLRLTNEDLAGMAAASRSKINEAMRELRAKNLVAEDTFRHRITLIDREALARLCVGKNGGDSIFRLLHGLSSKLSQP